MLSAIVRIFPPAIVTDWLQVIHEKGSPLPLHNVEECWLGYTLFLLVNWFPAMANIVTLPTWTR